MSCEKTRVCFTCKINKPWSTFLRISAGGDHPRTECKECGAKNRKKGNKKLLTRAEYEEKLEDQLYRCAICGSERYSEIRPDHEFAVDHDHATGQVRGLLCNDCNVGLGFFKDKTELLIKAAQYLDLWKSSART